MQRAGDARACEGWCLMLEVVESQWCNPREVGICSAANEVGEIGKTIDELEEIFVARLLQCLHANDQYSCPSIGVEVWISCLVLTQLPVEPHQRTPLFGNIHGLPRPKGPTCSLPNFSMAMATSPRISLSQQCAEPLLRASWWAWLPSWFWEAC
jgi:hypothetical protein